MLRLIAFSVLLSLCLPTLLVSFFETVGAGSAENDSKYARLFQGFSAASPKQHSEDSLQPAAQSIAAKSNCLYEVVGQDAIEKERLNLLGMPAEKTSATRMIRVTKEARHPCSLPSIDEANRIFVSPASL